MERSGRHNRPGGRLRKSSLRNGLGLLGLAILARASPLVLWRRRLLDKKRLKNGAVQNAVALTASFGRHGLLLVLLMALLAANLVHGAVSSTNSGPGSFFVATNGNDRWSGSVPAANPGKTDGPFATVTRAVQAVRDYRKQVGGGSNAPVGIFLRGGLYTLSEPIVLKPEDSNLVLAGYGTEAPVLSGGRRITGWQPVVVRGKSMLSAALADVRDGKWSFHELWVNGQRAPLARYPSHGYLKVSDIPDKAENTAHGVKRLKFDPKDLKPSLTLTNAELVVMSLWMDSHLPISSVNEVEQLINCTKQSNVPLKAGNPYYLEGAIDFLDEPGEWYLDQAGGVLYYLPRPGETPKNLEAIAPVMTQVIRLEGRPEAGELIERVRLRHLTFSHTEWYFTTVLGTTNAFAGPDPAPNPQAGGLGQGAYSLPAAVWGRGLRRCFVRDCTFTHLGNYGLELAEACESNLVSHCEFTDLGAGGIKLGGKIIPQKPAELSQHNEISDCRVHDGGKLFHDGQGILVFHSPNNRVVHNLIYDFSQVGISIGWSWGYGVSLATNNLIAYNHIHHLGVRTDGTGPILSDLGAIYTLGKQPGTKILNNLIHDIAGLEYGGWGIYFDEGSSSILAESNIVYRTTHGGFEQHYGATNGVLNNIFAFGRDCQLERTRAEPHLSFAFMFNIVYFDSGSLICGNWPPHEFRMDQNLYFDARPGATPASLRFQNGTLQQWQAQGNDLHSIVADPLFIAPRQYDFRLWSSSPAFKIGFRPIDISQVGIRK